MKLRWSRAALEDLRNIHDHIAQQSPTIAPSVITRIRDACRRLEIFPQSGRRSAIEGVLELVTPHLPYIVTYRIDGENIDVIGVFHAAQQPTRRQREQ